MHSIHRIEDSPRRSASSEDSAKELSFFELYGAKNLALSMLGEAARSLEVDPDLKTEEGRFTNDWVTDGRTGILTFEACLEILDIDESEGNDMVEALRQSMLSNPRKFRKALESVAKAIRQEGRECDFSDEDDLTEETSDPADPQDLWMIYTPNTRSINVRVPFQTSLHLEPPAMESRMRSCG